MAKPKQPWYEIMERADALWEKFQADLRADSLGEYVALERTAKAEYELAEGERDRE